MANTVQNASLVREADQNKPSTCQARFIFDLRSRKTLWQSVKDGLPMLNPDNHSITKALHAYTWAHSCFCYALSFLVDALNKATFERDSKVFPVESREFSTSHASDSRVVRLVAHYLSRLLVCTGALAHTKLLLRSIASLRRTV